MARVSGTRWAASLRLRPEHANSYFRRAYALHLMGQFEDAIADYTTVLRLDPDGPIAIKRDVHEFVVECAASAFVEAACIARGPSL